MAFSKRKDHGNLVLFLLTSCLFIAVDNAVAEVSSTSLKGRLLPPLNSESSLHSDFRYVKARLCC